MNLFRRADILLPNADDLKKWAVIACDQFTSDLEYWNRVRGFVGQAPSTLRMILPEAELDRVDENAISQINDTMRSYLDSGYFTMYPNAYIYIERTLEDGSVRPGVIGMVDLEAYDYESRSVAPVRATERTVIERLPPRVRARRDAEMEFPHVLMLCNDEKRELIEPVRHIRDDLPKLYDFELMEGGGNIRGWLLTGAEADAFDARFSQYSLDCAEQAEKMKGSAVILAVGDGNHSLAAAKRCYEELKEANPGADLSFHPARFALVELVNIHDPSMHFEPIHRIVTGVDREAMLRDIQRVCGEKGHCVTCIVDDRQMELKLGIMALPVAALQSFLDCWLTDNPGKIDYIHGESEVRRLASAPDAVGFLLPPFEKSSLFRGISRGGSLPRKTFSMGHAREKRYYLEGRKIK